MIVIGDIHGCYDTLMALIAKLPPDQPLCFAGDLIDRGPKSAQVVEFVKANGHDCVRGNHEQMMIDHYKDPSPRNLWFMNGGAKAIASYNDDWLLIEDHIKWMKSLPYFREYPHIKDDRGRHLVVSHANISRVWSPQHKGTDFFNNYALWNRSAPRDPGGIYNVHGHTPQVGGPRVKSFFANIDTGAVFKNNRYGTLTALQFPERIIYSQENVEKS